jgi:hypothetical protein
LSARREYPDACQATVVPLNVELLAKRLAREGKKVVYARGRYWTEITLGIYEGIHYLSRYSCEQARKPSALCWGYRATLENEDAARANGYLPIHIITDVDSYDVERLPARTRRELRQFERNDVRIVHLDDPEILQEQGYEVMLSWIGRTRHRAAQSRAEYADAAERHVHDSTRVVLAGIRDGRLLGYSVSWVVDGSAYIWDFHVASEALPLHLSTALWFETAQVFRRSGVAREICAGLAMPEREGLTDYKNRLGFELVRLPSIVWLLPVLSTYIRRRYPYKYYRFTGADTRSTGKGYSDSTRRHGGNDGQADLS